MSLIDPLARVADGARLAENVEIGPFCVVGPEVELRSGVRLLSHVNIAGRTVIGERTVVYPFASLGTPPQSLSYRGEPTRLVIGAGCTIRESVTINVGTKDGGGVTQVGDRGYFMAYSHIGHDCRVGSDVIFANSATLGGHCVIGDFVFMGGLATVHQHGQIGAHAFVGGMSGVRADIIPFGMADGAIARLRGLNLVGMRRRNFNPETIGTLRAVYRALFLGKGSREERLEKAQQRAAGDAAALQLVEFVRATHKRNLCLPGRRKPD